MNSHSISSRTPRIAPRWRSGRRMSLLITASSGWTPLNPSSASTSVGEILYSLAVAYPAANTFPIGESLMQAILSPQRSGDERNVNGECQYYNAFNQNHLLLYRRGLDARYGTGTADTLEERSAKQRRSGRKQ